MFGANICVICTVLIKGFEIALPGTKVLKRPVLFSLVVPLPHDWDNHPLDIKGREERVYLARLETGSYHYREVQDRFMQTKGAEKVCVK